MCLPRHCAGGTDGDARDPLDRLLGKKTADALDEAFEIRTVEDLLRHYPHRYASAGKELAEKEPPEGEHITIIARVASAAVVKMKNRPGQMLRVSLATDSQTVDVTFFNPQKVRHVIKPGVRAMFSGTVKYFRGKWSLTHPSYLILPEPRVGEEDSVVPLASIKGAGDLAGLARANQDPGAELDLSVFDRALIPLYPATREVESWTIMRCVRQVLDQLDPIEEPLPAETRAEHGFIGLDEALRTVHLPDTKEDIERAQDRLRFDEALSLQLVLAMRRHDNSERVAPACAPVAGGIADQFEEMLPFTLTEGQQAVAEEISTDLARPHPMSRLLQARSGQARRSWLCARCCRSSMRVISARCSHPPRSWQISTRDHCAR